MQKLHYGKGSVVVINTRVVVFHIPCHRSLPLFSVLNNGIENYRELYVEPAVSLEKGFAQLTVTLYTLSNYPSVHNQLIRTLFEAWPVVKEEEKRIFWLQISRVAERGRRRPKEILNFGSQTALHEEQGTGNGCMGSWKEFALCTLFISSLSIYSSTHDLWANAFQETLCTRIVTRTDLFIKLFNVCREYLVPQIKVPSLVVGPIGEWGGGRPIVKK